MTGIQKTITVLSFFLDRLSNNFIEDFYNHAVSIETTHRWCMYVCRLARAFAARINDLCQCMRFWYSDEGSGEPVQMCRLDRAFTAVIYGTEIELCSSKRVWYLLDYRVTKGSSEPVQPCEYSSKPSLLK